MRQCLECGTSFKSDKVEFCFACGAPLPEPSKEAVGPNLAEVLDPVELDVPEPEAIQEQDEPTEVLDYSETSQPIARPAGLDGARGPVTETPTGEVVLTEDLEIPVPMLQAPPPTAPVPLPSSAPEPSQSPFPSNIQVGNHLSEADTVPVEPAILSSAEVEEVDTADTDLPFFEAENTESLPNQGLPVVPDLSEPEMLGVLDEPTANLDPHKEYEMFCRFCELIRGKTALIISHRFSTVRMADRILVIDEGQIAESGTHDQLLAIRGIYSQMYEYSSQMRQIRHPI